MGRLPRAYLVVTAALGLSGCLLFTDPINKAPVVTIHQVTNSQVTNSQVTNSVVRGSPAEFTATVADEDKPQSWQLDWAVFDFKSPGCGGITAADWASPTVNIDTKDSAASYLFPAQTLETVCLCARATDHNGATGQSCLPITPGNPTPKATIEDVSGIPSGQPRPLCSQIHLSAENSTFPTGDQLLSGEQVQFDWNLTYSGADAAGKPVQLSKCTGFETGKPKSDQHRCLYAAGPGTDTGTYKVTLKITDSVVLNGNTTLFPSDPAHPAQFVIPVEKDTPPCLQRTDPDVYSKRILLSRNADLGGTYQSRTFTALSVKDDCNPFPPVPLLGGATSTPPQFVWSVLDSTQASPSWIQQVNATPSFTVSQVMFPNARPGDTIGLRVEIRDLAVQNSLKYGPVCSIDPPKDSPDICCGSACGSPNDCVRWTTWTVQFQP